VADLASQPTSIQSIYNWYKEDKLNVNRRYQRKLVWTLVEKQRLVESILKKYPIPAILIAERDQSGTFEIIDGLQRLHAIVSFIETKFPTLDDKYFNLEYFPTAKSQADEGLFEQNQTGELIDRNQVSIFLDYSLAISVMRNATEDEINDVFDRINTYGHRLSDQERRQAGVQNEFSDLVRNISCQLRGDDSAGILPLGLMPSISIDLPMTKHGYEVKADEVFWVQQGILRSTDLRDSMDEQCVADIIASIVGGELVTRSKVALDDIYIKDSEQCKKILDGLDVYGANRLSEEFKYCVEEIEKICNSGTSEKLRDIIFNQTTTNAFPSTFAALFIAFHELFIQDKKKIYDYSEAKAAINNLTSRIESSRKAGSPAERRKNINTIKGLISGSLVDAGNISHIYGEHSTVDIQNSIRRSKIELANYELKQGLLSLGTQRQIDANIIDKIVKTICAIANNGPNNTGKIIIGVADKEADNNKIHELDGIEGKKIGQRYVVGVSREAKALNISIEQYFSKWKDGIRNSELSVGLRDQVLSNIDYNDFYGLGIITITIPPQQEISYVGEETYFRSGDDTIHATTPKQIAAIAKRFYENA
jgi:hypothetical protein